MGYDLSPANVESGPFRFGAFTWPILLEACGYLFPSIHAGGRWYAVFDVDERYAGADYPPPAANGGFEVTAEESRIMARIARNFVAIQRTLPESHYHAVAGIESLMPCKWPVKIRPDLVDHIETFAAWSEHSGGFGIH